ncbi:TraB/GumN family protein [Chitinophaga sp.]|mgnify:CR=1 FL=1|uniref:TraB/GumN family protein n=1 Tax=Chitinophaga sp. TaxID=1869181 RepID=UPI002607EB57|nr:TraB/GumN family protein [uncultured Chitinophaga sp.]
MIKKTLAFLSLLLMMLPAMAQQSLLYKISGNGLPQPSYVYGTIHMICPQDFNFPDKLTKVVRAANVIYLELDMDDPAMMLNMAMMMQDKTPGYSLEKAFKPEDFRLLQQFMNDSMSMDIENFKKMKPLVLMSLLATKLLPCKKSESYEMKLVEMAKQYHKPVEGLETIEDQVSVFDNIADTTEARSIMEYVKNMAKQRDIMNRLMTSYKKQDVNALYNLVLETAETESDREELLDKRNRNWIPKMEKAMKKDLVLFAVGAGHLGGDQGVLSLLKKKGYKVEPVHK